MVAPKIWLFKCVLLFTIFSTFFFLIRIRFHSIYCYFMHTIRIFSVMLLNGSKLILLMLFLLLLSHPLMTLIISIDLFRDHFLSSLPWLLGLQCVFNWLKVKKNLNDSKKFKKTTATDFCRHISNCQIAFEIAHTNQTRAYFQFISTRTVAKI